ncbi:hypothetical protein U14_06008 [Candidatus Moduliflexus flocculans]|uniref:BrnT family toxin n=1 Tax=Candidatus Moduliflexus flocculans TaxID=1499966 RepID=A0A081BTI9_9BACT|nr:hypothetical protein U14_06008 [Candidatus Moduliflexus flocculans]
MDVRYTYNNIVFIWDEDKARLNRQKHGVRFEIAAEAFFDPFLVFVDASRNFEQRDALIGKTTTNQLLFVVHIQSDDDQIRIISARKATGREKNVYYEYQQP